MELVTLPHDDDEAPPFNTHDGSYGMCHDGTGTCLCHENPENVAAVNEDYQNGLLTDAEATQIVQGKTI